MAERRERQRTIRQSFKLSNNGDDKRLTLALEQIAIQLKSLNEREDKKYRLEEKLKLAQIRNLNEQRNK
tara:strand:+ start:3134 stop:3340 length:207 start_codon:yes stop_codon:yes gene_type:complete